MWKLICVYLPRITSLDLLLLPYQSFNLPANSSTQFDVCQHPAPHHVQQRLNLLNQQKIRLLDPVPIIKPQRHHLHQGPLTGITLLAHICATFINELCASLLTFLLFVPWQRLIPRNDRKLFSSNRGVSHLNEACHIDELSRGSVLGLKFSQTTSDRNVP